MRVMSLPSSAGVATSGSVTTARPPASSSALAGRGRLVPMEVLTPRDVPLGGLRAMTVRRTLPQRQRSLIGAWCFLDHYGPDDVDASGRHGRSAAPAHRAADGELAVHRRDRAPRLRRAPRDGPARRAQPDDGRTRHQPQRVLHARDHHPARRPALAGAARRRPAGRPGVRAPRPRACPRRGLGGAGLHRLAARLDLAGDDLQPAARGRAHAGGGYDAEGAARPVVRDRRARRHRHRPRRRQAAGHNELGFLEPGSDAVRARRRPRTPGCSSLGGPPFGEKIVMWWNFIGRDHDEVAAYRAQWESLRRDRRQRPVRAPGRRPARGPARPAPCPTRGWSSAAPDVLAVSAPRPTLCS